MKFAVDRIEENSAILQNLETKEIINVKLKKIKNKIKDGDILIYENNKYIKSDIEKENRLKELEEKFNKAKGLN